jgi:hypothetical protein
MAANFPPVPRRWDRQPATIPINLVLEAENFGVDDAAAILDFSLRGLGVLTTLALAPGDRVRILAKDALPDAIPTRVVWAREDEDESSHWTFAGLEFLPTSGD